MPQVWALLSVREGDNAQVLAVAEALGWPYETRRFENRPGAIVANLLAGPGIPGMVRYGADISAAPLPDLVLAAGTQSEPILAQLRLRAQRERRRTHQVFLGRPWVAPQRYDLVVTTPQYWVPPAPNVMELDLPLHRVTRESITREAERWQPRLAHLPRPYIVALLGGSISRYTLDARAAKRIAVEAGALAKREGGSLVVCSSYRTPRHALKMIAGNTSVPSMIFDWHETRGDNPYMALLGLADALVVTGDSMTMLAESCATGRPVYIFDLGEGRFGMRQNTPQHPPIAVEHPWLASAIRARLKDLKVTIINGILPRRLHRDTRNIHRKLIASGRAVWIGDDQPATRSANPPNDAATVAARIRALVEGAAQPDRRNDGRPALVADRA